MTKYTCIDSFCGAGGLGLGLKRSGFDILLSFDIDKLCIDTINRNQKYFNHPAMVADIADMLDGKLLKQCNLNRGELFLLAGGPPCQGFSVQRRGRDIDSRNELVLMYGKLIDEVYPKYFVMENVSGIAGKRGKTILQQLVENVERVGYHVHIKLLDAQDFGVPQRRRRYIVVGERKDVGNNYVYPTPTGMHRTVRDTIGDLPVPPQDGTDYPGLSLHRIVYLNEICSEFVQLRKGRDATISPMIC